MIRSTAFIGAVHHLVAILHDSEPLGVDPATLSVDQLGWTLDKAEVRYNELDQLLDEPILRDATRIWAHENILIELKTIRICRAELLRREVWHDQ